MVEGKASLVIDLGNSETRVITIFGKTFEGKPRQKISILPNKFGELSDAKLLNNPDYNESNSKVFAVGVEGSDKKSYFCSGLMCDREKGTVAIRPSSSIKKYDSAISMYTIRLAFLEAYKHISEITKTSIEFLDIEWNVSVLLPPSDLDLGADKMRQNILDLKNIEFLMPVFKRHLNIRQVKVFPEGFCAFIGEVFEYSAKIRSGYETVLKSSTLIIDIGAGTTDLCIIKDVKLVDGSRYSEETGGNQIFQKINMSLRRTLGKNLPEDSLRIASVKGEVQIGSRVISIINEVEIAKKDVATKLSSAIRNYIESSDYSIYDIENILICGGGAEECKVEGMKSLGDYLKDDLKVWMNYSHFLDIPTEVVRTVVDNVEKSETVRISPRLLNVRGAAVLSENL